MRKVISSRFNSNKPPISQKAALQEAAFGGFTIETVSVYSYPFSFLISAVSAGSTSNKSPTMA